MNEYSANDLQSISDLEHVRLRPAMYIGDTSTRGICHLVIELVDNVADLFLKGLATEIDIQLDGRSITVADDGPGLPFDEPNPDADSLASKYLTQMHRTPTADKHWPHLHVHGFGCGVFLVTALSECTKVRSWRGDQLWEQSFQRGEAMETPRVVDSGESKGKGTTFRFTPDPVIFADHRVSLVQLREKLKALSCLLPGFKLTLGKETFQSPQGLADWAREFALQEHSEDLSEDTTQPYNREPLWVTDHTGKFHFQLAAAGNSDETEWITFANGARTHEGGTHLTSLKRLFNHAGWKPAVAILHVTMHSPVYAGPTRGKLDVPGIYAPMKDALEGEITKYCQNFKG